MFLLYTIEMGYDRGELLRFEDFFTPASRPHTAGRRRGKLHENQAFALPVLGSPRCSCRASRLVKSIEMLHTPAAPMMV